MLTCDDLYKTELRRIELMQEHPILSQLERALNDAAPSAATVLRFAWALEPFVVAFHYYNVTFLPAVFRGKSKLHTAIRAHASKDARHMTWYYQDLRHLGQATRPHAVNCLAARIVPALEKLLAELVEHGQELACLAAIESVEETGAVFFKACADAASTIGGGKLTFFAQRHSDNETGSLLDEHAGYGLPEYLAEHNPGQDELKYAIEAVNVVFDLFTELLDDLADESGAPGLIPAARVSVAHAMTAHAQALS